MTRFTLGFLLAVCVAACHSAPVVSAPAKKPVATAAPEAKVATVPAPVSPAVSPAKTAVVKSEEQAPVPGASAVSPVKTVIVESEAQPAAQPETAVAPPAPPVMPERHAKHERHHRVARAGHDRGHSRQARRHESPAQSAEVAVRAPSRNLEERALIARQPPALELVETLSPLLTKDSLNQFVHERIHTIQSCYERELRLHTTLHGDIDVEFTVTPSGHVRHSRVERDTVRDAAVSTCIVDHINGWMTPFRPDAGVRVSFPFVFGPSELSVKDGSAPHRGAIDG